MVFYRAKRSPFHGCQVFVCRPNVRRIARVLNLDYGFDGSFPQLERVEERAARAWLPAASSPRMAGNRYRVAVLGTNASPP
jgi:hypothetical protein